MNSDEQRRTAAEERRAVGALEREEDPPAALAAIEAVMALHKPESRFTVRGYENISFSSVEIAQEFVGKPVEPQGFTYCVECNRIEGGATVNAIEFGYGYGASLYPCPTRRALGAVIDDYRERGVEIDLPITHVQAKAWDEGYSCGWIDAQYDQPDNEPNPYREDEK